MTTLISPELKELEGKIAQRQNVLAGVFAEAKTSDGALDLSKVTTLTGSTSSERAAEIKTMNDELTDLRTQADALKTTLRIAQSLADLPESAGDDSDSGASRKSIGAQFAQSAQFKGRPRGGDSVPFIADVDAKTLMTTAAGFAPESVRSGRVVDIATRPIQVIDVIPQYPISQAAYKYMEETTFTNNAAETSEGGTFGEAALVYTERVETVQKITVWLPVTDEQLEDVPGIEARINQRLPFMLRQRLDLQALVGNGTAPNMLGINAKSGIQTQAKGTDPVFDAILKAATKTRVTGQAFPDLVIFHPNDLQDLRLTRTTDGLYILGNPDGAGPSTIWGLRIVEAQAQTENTAVVGDFANFAEFHLRRDVEIKVSNSHGTMFVEGKQAIRADMRGLFAWLRAAAFCAVTGI